MVKIFIMNLNPKGSTIKHQMESGSSNTQISKSFRILESTVRYYRKRPEIKEIKVLLNCLENILRKFMNYI